MNDPFGAPIPATAASKNYLMLVSASKDNAKAIQDVLANLKNTVDKNASTLWIDSKGIGVFITTDLVAADIRAAAFEGASNDFSDVKDAVIIEVGNDWYASKDTPMKNWLTAHVGAPLDPPLDSRVSRRKGKPR
jgi:hypothetical protein